MLGPVVRLSHQVATIATNLPQVISREHATIQLKGTVGVIPSARLRRVQQKLQIPMAIGRTYIQEPLAFLQDPLKVHVVPMPRLLVTHVTMSMALLLRLSHVLLVINGMEVPQNAQPTQDGAVLHLLLH
jgi:hypothetical protein